MGNPGKEKVFAWDVALQESSSLNHERVGIIRCNASSPAFITWFHISCYFPVITACLGPVANAISIACVVERWRFTRVIENGVEVGIHSLRDPQGIFAVNILSLVFGCLSNVVLLLHFSEKLSYLRSQCICIFGWTTASFMLLIDVIVCGTRYLDDAHEKSIGFWYAVITSGLYFGCTITLTVHFIGYLLSIYPPKFNLLKNERSLMVFTVSFSIILMCGAGMFSRLLHLSFGNSLYFCVVSVLTIGLGDILPSSDATRVLILIYSYLGVINLALIVTMTTGIIRATGSSVIFFHQVEVFREKELTRLENNEIAYTPEQAFYKMIDFRKRARSRRQMHSLLSVLIAFIIFWNLGSLGLKFAEDWSYFDGVYFCFLCLITIGYGDFAPASGAGRAFFVLWALGAVPLMSAIISTLGDILLDLSDKMDLSISRKFGSGFRSIIIFCSRSFQNYVLSTNEVLPEDIDEDENDESDPYDGSQERNTCDHDDSILSYPGSLLSSSSHNQGKIDILHQYQDSLHNSNRLGHIGTISNSSLRNSKLCEIRHLSNILKKFRFIARQNKNYSLSYEQWEDIRRLLILHREPEVVSDPYFWLSDQSPLRFPMDQPKFVILHLLSRLEELINSLIEEDNTDLLTPSKDMLMGPSFDAQGLIRHRDRNLAYGRVRSLSV